MTASEQHKNQVIAEQYKTLIKESQRDPLTGVYNRMAFEEIASRKAPLPPMCAVAMIDIDHFKPENRGIYTQSDSPKKSSRNIWSLAVVSVDQRY